MNKWFLLLILLFVMCDLNSQENQEPYKEDSIISKIIHELPKGSSILLPTVKHMYEGKEINGDGYKGPYARDYTTKMVYAPDRKTSLYMGGNHGAGRTNDTWEFHLGSNTWYCLFPAEGGDHATYKWTLMFASRIFEKTPDYKMSEKEQKNFDDCKKWWKDNTNLKDGMYLTKNGGPLLVGHTWDTLVYEPNTKKVIQGTGAYCASSDWLESKFSEVPIADVQAKLGKSPDGKPYKTMWFFDTKTMKWSRYASEEKLAELKGMGGSMIYIPDLKKVIWYYAGQNTTGASLCMSAWDPVKDTWEDLKPNGGKGIFHLALQAKIAPESEAQLRYAPKHKKIVAVVKKGTFSYDIEKNEWNKLNDSIPFNADDANTIFDYDSSTDNFLLCSPRDGKLACFDLTKNTWKLLTPTGPGIPKPPYCVGKGYFDPTYNVFVVQSAYTNKIWVYKHTNIE